MKNWFILVLMLFCFAGVGVSHSDQGDTTDFTSPNIYGDWLDSSQVFLNIYDHSNLTGKVTNEVKISIGPRRLGKTVTYQDEKGNCKAKTSALIAVGPDKFSPTQNGLGTTGNPTSIYCRVHIPREIPVAYKIVDPDHLWVKTGGREGVLERIKLDSDDGFSENIPVTE